LHEPSDGVYYVLSLDRSRGTFVFQHDTHHVGMLGPHWEVVTYTEIHPGSGLLGGPMKSDTHPPVGWLREHLLRLVQCYQPNSFSVT
jgi:hypothetical protein